MIINFKDRYNEFLDRLSTNKAERDLFKHTITQEYFIERAKSSIINSMCVIDGKFVLRLEVYDSDNHCKNRIVLLSLISLTNECIELGTADVNESFNVKFKYDISARFKSWETHIESIIINELALIYIED